MEPVKVERISTVAARDGFAEILNRVSFGKSRIILTRHGKDLVAVIPIEDLQHIIQKGSNCAKTTPIT